MSYHHIKWAMAQDVTPTEAHVLLVLAVHYGNNDAAFPTIDTLSAETKLSRACVKFALRTLAGKGKTEKDAPLRPALIEIEQTTNGANRYRFIMPAVDLVTAEPDPITAHLEADPTTATEPTQGGYQVAGGGYVVAGGGLRGSPIKEKGKEKENKTGEGDLFGPQTPPPKTATDPHALPLPDCVPLPLWREWIAYRRERRLSCSPTTLTKQLEFLADLNRQGHPPRTVIENSIRNGWQGLFQPKTATADTQPAPFRQSSRRVYS